MSELKEKYLDLIKELGFAGMEELIRAGFQVGQVVICKPLGTWSGSKEIGAIDAACIRFTTDEDNAPYVQVKIDAKGRTILADMSECYATPEAYFASVEESEEEEANS